MAKNDDPRTIPPYLPFETFVTALAHFKATAVPGRIDKTAFPSDMHRLQRGQVQSALKFLSLIDDSENTRPELRKLVAAHGTEEWGESLVEIVFEKYARLIGDLDLDTATQKQLDDRFHAAGVSGQMLMKAVRFYLALMTAADLTFSPHLVARRTTGNGAPKKRTPRKPASQNTSGGAKSTRNKETPPQTDALPPGLIEFPIPIGTSASFIRVPRDITTKDIPLVQAIFSAVEALAKQNGGGK